MKSLKERSQGHWTMEEKRLFMEGYRRFGRCWTKYREVLPSRDARQVRSHAQKCLKKGVNELEREVRGEERCRCEEPTFPEVVEMGVQCDELDVLLDGHWDLLTPDSSPSQDTKDTEYEGFWECPQTYI